jgi:proline iminopeptidase
MGDCLSRFDVRDRLHEIKVPVFVYVGRYDWITPVKLNEDLASAIKGSKLVVYEKSGHMAPLEQQTAFQNDVREFVKGLNIQGIGA